MLRRRSTASGVSPALIPIVHLWILRLLIPLGLHRHFIMDNDLYDDALAEALGLQMHQESNEFDASVVRAELRTRHLAMEDHAGTLAVPERLADNISRLQALVGLSDIDCRILEFAVLIHSERLLDDLADHLGVASQSRTSLPLWPSGDRQNRLCPMAR